MDFKRLLKTEGATLDKNLEAVNLGRGYAVSLTDNPCRTVNDLKRTYIEIKSMAKYFDLKDYFIGYWRDLQSNTGYLDLTLILNSLQDSLDVALAFNQKAVFNFKSMKSIYIKNGG